MKDWRRKDEADVNDEKRTNCDVGSPGAIPGWLNLQT